MSTRPIPNLQDLQKNFAMQTMMSLLKTNTKIRKGSQVRGVRAADGARRLDAPSGEIHPYVWVALDTIPDSKLSETGETVI